MDEKMTVLELRKAKKEELKAVINRLKELEKENEATKHGPMEAHFGIAKEVDKLYLRRRTLKDFLKELDNGKQLIISAEKVMHFLEGTKNV